MQLDYDLRVGLEEWVGGTYQITHDFYRLIIHTDEMQKKVWHYFGKIVPIDAVIKLEEEELDEIHYLLTHCEGFYTGLAGSFGSYRVKAFTLNTFYNNEDAVATDDELDYEFKWEEL